MPHTVSIAWLELPGYPEFEVSNTGRFRHRWSQTEVERDALGVAMLYPTFDSPRERVCAWTMANRYFYGLPKVRSIVNSSCLAR